MLPIEPLAIGSIALLLEVAVLESLYLNLGQHDALSDAEKALLAGAMSSEKHFAIGQDIVASGSRPTYSTLILDGLAARYKVLEDGGRQFTSLQVPGDFVDLHAFLLKTMDRWLTAQSTANGSLRWAGGRRPRILLILSVNSLSGSRSSSIPMA